jgi:hypothetical protein
MAITITPAYPVVGDELVLTVSNPRGNEYVFFVSTLPTVSEVLAGMLFDSFGNDRPDEGLTQYTTKLQTVIDNDGISTRFSPDASGSYTFIAYETRHVQGIPAYPGDPRGAIVQNLVLTQTNAIYVGELMDLHLLTADGDGATLRLQVNNDTVRAASLVDPRSEAAAVAVKQTTVVAALAACVAVTVSNVGTDLIAAVNDLRAKYEAHRVLVGAPPVVHILADSDNVVRYSAASDTDGAILLLNDVRDKLARHLLDSTSSGHAWHTGTLDDLQNLPLAPSATDRATAAVLCADLRWRAYNRHRLANATTPTDPRVHIGADTTNTLATAVTVMDTVIVTFFDALISLANAAQDGENQGEVGLRAEHGFTRAP